MEEVLAAVDQAYSRFRADSELTAVNAAAGREVKLSPLLNQAVAAALEAARRTGGAVDPTVGAAVRRSGYDRDFAEVPREGSALAPIAGPVPGWREIQHREADAVLLAPAGVELDLGATGKALAADLAAASALRATGSGVLVNLAGDLVVAGPAPPTGWPVQISEDSAAPLSPGEETVEIRVGALATSSTTVRRWTRGGVSLHHLIDPRTGLPAEGPWRTVTVAARTCVQANTASTATLALAGEGQDWLRGTGLPARLVGREGEVVRMGGWPERQA